MELAEGVEVIGVANILLSACVPWLIRYCTQQGTDLNSRGHFWSSLQERFYLFYRLDCNKFALT